MDTQLTHFRSGWALLDALPLSVYVKDRESKFLYVNKASALSLGLTDASQAKGKTDRDFFEPNAARDWIDLEQKMMRSGVPIIDHVAPELRLRTEGPPHWVLTCKYPCYDEEQHIVGLIGISKHIDEEHEEVLGKNLAVQGAQVGLWYVSCHQPNANEAWFSPGWKRMLGYEDTEIKNWRTEFESRVHQEDLPKVREARNRYLDNPQVEGHYECEFRMRHKNGSWIWIRSYGEGKFSDDGRTCLAFAGSHTDITASKDEHELHEAILSVLPALVFIKNEEKRFIFVNPELARYCGTTKEKMENEQERDSYYNSNKEQTDRFERGDERVLGDNEEALMLSKGLVIDCEEIINRADGQTRHLKTIKKLFMYPSRDPKKHILGIATDITHTLRKEREQQARLSRTLDWLTASILAVEQAESEEEACLQALVRLEAFGRDIGVSSFMLSLVREKDGRQVIVGDPGLATGKLVNIASNTTRYCDEPTESLDILPWVLFQHEEAYFVPDSRTHGRCKNELCITNQPPIISQYIIPIQSSRSKFGTLQIEVGERTDEPPESFVYKAISASLSMAIESHRRAKETETLRNENEERKLQAMAGVFYRVYAHEALNGVKAIESWINNSKRASPNYDTLTSRVAEIHSNVSELLDATASSRLKRRRCAFNEEIVKVLELLGFRHQKKFDRCEIRWDIAGHPHREVNFDPTTLIPILNNLVINAKEQYALAGKSGPISISIVENNIDDQQYVGVQVHDYAVGVPDENKGKIFEQGWSTKPKGQGLGLWFVKKLVEACEGRVLVESTYGHYAQFLIMYPIAAEN